LNVSDHKTRQLAALMWLAVRNLNGLYAASYVLNQDSCLLLLLLLPQSILAVLLLLLPPDRLSAAGAAPVSEGQLTSSLGRKIVPTQFELMMLSLYHAGLLA
jgi:hypothetical protein